MCLNIKIIDHPTTKTETSKNFESELQMETFALISQVDGYFTKYLIKNVQRDTFLTFSEVLELWISRDSTFYSTFLGIFRSYSKTSYLIECIPISNSSAPLTPFQFCLCENSSLDQCLQDEQTFSDYFPKDEFGEFNRCKDEVVSFPNIRRDALLVIPCPQSTHSNTQFAHLGCFLRTASDEQISNIWSEVAIQAQRILSNSSAPLWISTHGTGVSWLHIRLDSYPKYYSYQPYRHFE